MVSGFFMHHCLAMQFWLQHTFNEFNFVCIYSTAESERHKFRFHLFDSYSLTLS